jgi:hypothetical protein
LAWLRELSEGFGMERCQEGVQVEVTNPALGAVLAGNLRVGFQEGAAMAHQGSVFSQKRPGHETVNVLAQRC